MVLILALALIVETACGSRIAPPAKNESLKQGTGMPLTTAAPEAVRVDASEEPKQSKETPRAFRKIDFKNLSYQISWNNERISLQDGKREYYQHKNLGNGWFELEDVYYGDVTGDEREEAVVVLTAVLCGVSCDGGSALFYFYSVEKGALKLLWRFETGSLAYGCGLKSFGLEKRRIALEVFNTCFFNGAILEPRGHLEERARKFYAESVTRFLFEFKEGKPVMRKRIILPSFRQELRSYSAQISINNDR